MHDSTKVSENYHCDFPKVNKMTARDSFNMPKVSKRIKLACPKLVNVTSNLLDLDVKQS